MCLPYFFFLPEPFNQIPIRVPYFTVYLIFVIAGWPADEFQLVLYIMSIKGLQFLTSGIGMMCFAAFKYFMCVHPGGPHDCDKYGPGANVPVVTGLIDWFGISILVWIAFLWLPCSVRSAGLRDMLPAADDDEAGEGSGRTCCGAARERGKG